MGNGKPSKTTEVVQIIMEEVPNINDEFVKSIIDGIENGDVADDVVLQRSIVNLDDEKTVEITEEPLTIPVEAMLVNDSMYVNSSVSDKIEQPVAAMRLVKDCNNEIISLIKKRMEIGAKEYGHGVIQNDVAKANDLKTYDWLNEALEEALDLSIYLSAKIIEVRNKITHKDV